MKELAGDDESLNLAGAFADGEELHVAEVFLCRVVLHESVAAVDLHALFGDPHSGLAGVQFCHGGLARHALAVIAHVGRAVGEQPRGFDPRGGIRWVIADKAAYWRK